MHLSESESALLIVALRAIAHDLLCMQSPFGLTGPSNSDLPEVNKLIARVVDYRKAVSKPESLESLQGRGGKHLEYGAEFLYHSDIKPTIKVTRGRDRTPVYLQAVGAYEAAFMRKLTEVINEYMNLSAEDI